MPDPEELNGNLKSFLDENPEAYEYFESLHPSVRARISGEPVSSQEELAALANRAMSLNLIDISGIYDDSDSWPNGSVES